MRHWAWFEGADFMAEASSPTANPKSKPRHEPPLSPHLQIWRWHVTMAGSILHRATGVALYAGAIGLALWLAAGAYGATSFGLVELALNSLPGQIALFALLFSLVYHFVNGLRHLIWDAGAGINPRFANFSGWLALIIAFVVPIFVFALSAL